MLAFFDTSDTRPDTTRPTLHRIQPTTALWAIKTMYIQMPVLKLRQYVTRTTALWAIRSVFVILMSVVSTRQYTTRITAR